MAGTTGTSEANIKLKSSYLKEYFAISFTAALSVFLVNFAMGMPTAGLPRVLKYFVGANPAALAMAELAIFGVGKCIADLLGGWLSDWLKGGRRAVILTGTILVLGGVLLIYFSIPGDVQAAALDQLVKTKKIMPFNAMAFWLIMLGQFLNGFGLGLQNGAAMISLQDLGGASRRGVGASLQKFSLYGGKTIATYLGGFLVIATGLVMWPFLFTAILVAIALVLNLVVVKDTKRLVLEPAGVKREVPGLRAYKTAFTNGSLYTVYFLGLMAKWADSWFITVLSLYVVLYGYGVAEAGVIATAYGLTWSVLNYYTGAMSDFIGRKRLTQWGTALSIIAPLLFLWFITPGNVTVPVILAAFWGIATGLFYGVLEVVPGDVAKLEDRGAVIGTFRFWRDAGNIIAPMIFGVIWSIWGQTELAVRYMIYLTSFLYLVMFLLVVFVMKETFEVKKPAVEQAGGKAAAG